MITSIARYNHADPDGWEHDAACLDRDPELFFPVTFEGVQGGLQAKEARAICDRCPVREACLEAALEREGGKHVNYRSGVWGGKTPTQRYNIHKQRQRAGQYGAAA